MLIQICWILCFLCIIYFAAHGYLKKYQIILGLHSLVVTHNAYSEQTETAPYCDLIDLIDSNENDFIENPEQSTFIQSLEYYDPHDIS